MPRRHLPFACGEGADVGGIFFLPMGKGQPQAPKIFAAIAADKKGIENMKESTRKETFKLVLAAMFVALGLVFPTIFHTFNMAGPMFLPMHIPVLLCGLICGWKYGLLVGIVTPLLSSAMTGMPPMYPVGVTMMLELGTYGLVTGLVAKKQNYIVALVVAMLAGRLVSGLANVALLGVAKYGIKAFLTGSFVTALPGIILQLVLIPAVMLLLDRTHVLEKVKA